jgi:hypothetical protein
VCFDSTELYLIQEVLGRTNSPAFHTCHLFEVLEPNLTEFTAVNNLVAMVTMENKQSKPTVEQGSPNNFEPQ